MMEETPGSRPVPDPTLLTTAALDREIAALKRELDLRIVSLEKLVTDRMKVVEERRVEQKEDTKVELDAALTAQKESVSKLEGAFEKSQDNLRRELSELREAINRIIERKIGGSEVEGAQRVQQSASIGASGLIIALAGVGVSLLAVVVIVLIAVL